MRKLDIVVDAFCKYSEYPKDIQEMILKMCNIANDPKFDADEKAMAFHTLQEALYFEPSSCQGAVLEPRNPAPRCILVKEG